MRIFTLGKKGVPLFFFALFLLTGTYTYGQNCPNVVDEDAGTAGNQQSACYLATVADLQATANGDGVVWYRTATSTNPIPANEFLENATYYAGNVSGNCASRPAVEVTVVNAGPPTSLFGVTFQPCEYDENDTSTVADLIALIQGNEVQIFDDEFSEVALDPTTILIDGENYFAGQRSSTDCSTSSRLALRYDPIIALAPTAEPSQVFCQGATVADLQAQATHPNAQAFRWYSTATSNPALSPSTPLVDGETYFATQIVNRANSPLPPCESQERFAVTVELLTGDAGNPNTGIVCETDVQDTFPSIDAIRNYFLGLLDEGVSTNGTFNPTPEELAQQYQNDSDGLGDFTTTYTLGADECEASVNLTVSIIPAEQANAGGDVTVELSVGDAPLNLFTSITSGAQTIGTFVGYPDGVFDPAAEGEGTYTITYTVDETSGCITGSDSAIFTVVVTPCQSNAGADVNADFCRSEAEALAAQLAGASTDEERNAILASFLGDRDTDGTFSGDPGSELASKYFAGVYPFSVSTTYTVGTGICEDQAAISITVYQDVNAGDDASITLNPNDAPVNLFTLLGDNAQAGGTWNMGDGIFDPATDAPGTYIYTVGTGCTDSASVVVSVVTDPVDPGTPTGGYAIVCVGDVDTFFPSFDEIRKFYLRLLPTGVATNGTFNPTPSQISAMYQADADGLGEFTTIYTAPGGQTYELTVNVVAEANAGDDATLTLTTEDDAVNLFSFLGENAQQGGTWSNGNGIFDPATDEPGTFTYTVGYEGCMDSAVVTVVVNEPTDPTDPTDPVTPGTGYAVVCQGDVDTFFPSFDEIRKFYLRLLPTGVATNGTFNPTPSQISAMYQADADGLGEFTTIYTAPDGQTYELTVNVVAEANAGDDATVTLSTEDDAVNLFNFLGENAQQGGTWSNGDGTFDPATDEPGTFIYTVGYEGCMDSATVTVTVTSDPTDPCEGVVDAGTDSSTTVCETDVQATFPSVDEIRKFYLNLLDSGVARTGTLNPTAAQIATMYQNDADGLGDFTTTYTLINGECTDSVQLTVTIIPVEQANAGTINDLEICASENLFDLSSVLGDDSSPGGKFLNAAGNEISGGALDVSVAGTYTITYSVSEDDAGTCVTGSDSTQFTITVTENTANAGADNSRIVCNSEVRNLSNTGVRNLFLNLLEAGVDRTGTFNPTIQQIIDQYNFQSNFGDFTTTYTVGTGDCQDSAVLTVTVLENPDAGQSATVNLEEGTTETVDLFAELGGTPETGGVWTFAGEEVDGTFDPATDEEGVYTYTVTSDNGCTASATVTVIVGTEEPNCPEVTETEQTFCGGTPTVADLAPAGVLWYASADGTTPIDATTALVDGTVYFAGPVDGTCDDRDSVTVTLSDNPAAPTVAEFDGCVADSPTVADLDITGEDGATFTVYADEALENPVAMTAMLEEGSYFVTQTNDAGCVSEASEITVTLNDAATPTLTTGGNVFCEFDGATIADLQENVSGTGTIIWYTSATGTQTVPQNTVLQNNTTYFAAAIDATTGCESSQRLSVTVTLEVCEIMIPEAFSPNGDGMNDRFVVLNIGSEYPNHKMEIYNRWGEPVFVGQVGEAQGWDGTSTEGSFGSGVLPAGVYFYILYFNDGQTAPTQGRVYLSR